MDVEIEGETIDYRITEISEPADAWTHLYHNRINVVCVEPKNRKQVRIRLESELLIALKANGMDASDTINLALENHLTQKKMVYAH